METSLPVPLYATIQLCFLSNRVFHIKQQHHCKLALMGFQQLQQDQTEQNFVPYGILKLTMIAQK